MIFKNLNKKKIINTSILLFLITLNIWLQFTWLQNQLIDLKNKDDKFLGQNVPQTSETDYFSEDWISNGDFSSGSSNWYSEISGDTTDANAYVGSGAANYVVDGNTGSFSLTEDPPNNSSGDWHPVSDPYFPSAANPYQDGINADGFWFRHYFQEGSGLYTQLASRLWARDFTLDRNVSDYIITSASLTATFNATVYRDVDIPGDTVATSTSTDYITYSSSWDFGRFFLLLSDVDRNIIYEAGYYHIDSLGAGYSGQVSMSDTGLITVTGDTLIYFLTSILSQDYQHFSIALGIRVYCEDNRSPSDSDRWQYLLFNYLSLTFTYEKKIDPQSKISWKQDGSTIPSNYEIDNATLNFQYKIDKDWTANTGSPNSEFRIIINNNQLGETVKLATATSTYKYFKQGGLDVSNFLVPDEEVNLSIQVYIGDEFTLDTDITISIDNVTLIIGYGIFTPPDTSSYDLILNNIDRTTEKSTQVTYDENLNITFIYKNSTGDFISGASVQLTGGGLSPITLSKDVIYDQYYTIIDSTDLGVGTSYLTLTASKRYHTSQEFQITVTIVSRQTQLQLFLNGNNETINKEITTSWNQNLNISIKYLDIEQGSNIHVSEADVELTGAGDIKLLFEDSLNEQYELEINTNILGVGVTYLTVYASKENYTSLNIRFKVTVNLRSTYLDNILLDSTPTTSLEVEWNEFFDVSVSYNDSLTDNFIGGATVQLIGPGYSKTLTQSGQNAYIKSINSFDFAIGNNFLTILAQKDNYSIASQLITIRVIERDTSIEIELNMTTTTAISYPHDELLNITAFYKDSLGTFIDGAIVELKEGSTVLHNLTEDLVYNQYSFIINTNELSLGVNLLTIYAKKDNFTAAASSITITVNERDTSLEVYLDEVLRTALTSSYDEFINITVIYEDYMGSFLDGATVQLREGETILFSFDPHLTYNQYYLTINTKDLDLGVNALAIYAKKQNYTAALVSIIITVNERDTDLELFLNENPTSTIQIAYGETLNITAIYKDYTGTFLDNAVVQLRKGGSTLYNLSKHLTYDQYYVSINTNQLILGVNILSIYAKKVNFTAGLVSIIITVTERDTNLDIFLEQIQTTSVEIQYGESVNITAIYTDFTYTFLDNAVVQLRRGGSTLFNLSKHLTYNQYYVSIDSSLLNLGANLLAVYAKKQNFTVALVSITITVNERDTTLDVLLEGLNSASIEFYNISVNEYLNITAIYNDFTEVFIDSATLKLTGSGITRSLSSHPTFNQYNYTLKVEDLGIGVHFLVVSAEKENYSSSIVNIKLNVLERRAYLQLFVDTVNNLTSSRYITAEIDQILNITVFFKDFIDKAHLTGANVRLTGALNKNFTENLGYEHYNVSISSNKLGQGINFLTIFAQKEGYKSESILFTIEVVEKISNLQLFLNSVNKTLDKSVEVTIGEFVNISIFYNDYSGLFIDGANVIIVGEGISLNLTKHPFYDQYNVSINSNDLNFGINLLTLYAQKVNYQPQTLIVRIEIIEKETGIDILLNGLDKTIDRTLSIPIRKLLNITINYFDFESGNPITGATIQVVGEGLLLNLTENPLNHRYSISIDTSLLDIGVRFLTVYCQRPNYQSYSALLRIQVDRIKTNISTVTGETVVNLIPGDNYRLKIRLYDLDFNLSVLNATVRYTWAYGQGDLTDEDNDGVYEALLSNLPVGTFLVTISVYAGDDYEFERFQITMNIVSPPENVLLFQILTIAGIAAAIGVSGYLLAYQKILKYPKQVRKIHKFKSKLKKPKSIGVEVQTREEVIDKHYSEEITALEKQIKKKLGPKSDISQPSNDKIDKTKEIELSKK